VAGEIVGDEFHVRVNTPDITGLYPARWLEALTDEAGNALGTEIATGGGDWPQLWAFLCGLHDAIVPLKLESAASLLADRGLTPSIGYPIAGWQPAGDALVARDAYGSRFLVVAPFGQTKTDMQDGPAVSPEPDHWYAWDLDWCSLDLVVAAGPRGSAAEALAEWRHAVGPVAASAELSPGPPDLIVRLLHPALALGTLWETPMMGGEPVELMREYFRLHHRARVLAEYLIDRFPEQTADEAEEPEAEDPAESFLDWYSERDGASSPSRDQAAEAVESILAEWGPFSSPDEEMLYACSPHRIEVTGGCCATVTSPSRPTRRCDCSRPGHSGACAAGRSARRRRRAPWRPRAPKRRSSSTRITSTAVTRNATPSFAKSDTDPRRQRPPLVVVG
jgi:hypothetical protein